MQNKTELYGNQIQNLVEQITDICKSNGIPMLMVFCIDQQDQEDEKIEATLAGSLFLDKTLNPPPAMVLAAAILKFDCSEFEY